MKVLFLVPYYPFLRGGGNAYITKSLLNLFRSENHEIGYIGYLAQDETRDNSERRIIDYCLQNNIRLSECQLIPKPSKYRGSYIFYHKRVSYLFFRYYSPLLVEKMVQMLESGRYDSVWIEHTYTYGNVMLSPTLRNVIRERQVKTIISAHVIESRVRRQLYASYLPRWLERVANRLVSDRIERDEEEALGVADKVIFLGPEEPGYLAIHLNDIDHRVYRPRIEARGNPYMETQESRINRIHKSCVFFGTFTWHPNREGLRYLLEEVLPLLFLTESRVELVVFGRGLPRWAARYQRHPNVRVLGEVEDIQSELLKHDLVLAPLTIGGGTRIKILEAMTMGIPVIATPQGAEGVAWYGRAICVCKTAREFAEAVVRVLRDPAELSHMSECAIESVKRYYGFDETQAFIDWIHRY